MDPLTWLREQYARITGLPDRLARVAADARAVMADPTQPRELRERASRLWAAAVTDRAEAQRLLRDHIRTQQQGMSGLQAFPIVFLIGGLTAAAAMSTLVALFGRASAYERELALIESGTVSVSDVERLRETSPDAPGGVTASIREAGNIVKLALIGAAGIAAFKLWGKRG